MIYPICSSCLEASELCSSCKQELEKGVVSQLDVDVSRYMKKLEKQFDINGVDLVKTHDLGSFILIVGRGKISAMIGRKGRNIKLMSSKFDKRVRIIKQGDVRQMASDLISPARVSAVNVLYTAEGEKYKVIIPNHDRRKIYMDQKTLNKAIDVLFNGDVIIHYQ